MVSYQNYSEEDTKLKLITPALNARGWGAMNLTMEYPLKDDRYQVVPGTNKTTRIPQKKQYRTDYVLLRAANQPLAVLEAKAYEYPDSQGIDQAKKYAELLDVPFAYSSSGHGFVEFNRLTGEQKEIPLHKFPTPDELWEMWCEAKGISREARESLDYASYYTSSSGKVPRYYQLLAINKTINAIFNEHKKRILLVMATGTGKTYTAFQIVWRFREAMRAKNPNSSIRVLYLADRNILVDQTLRDDFAPFGGAAAKIRKGKIDDAVEISFGLYQQLKGPRQCPTGSAEAEVLDENFEEDVSEEGTECFIDHYKSVPPDYFDLIIVDECHRGSARDESSWREILNYYSSAVQIGMTATPNYKDGSNNIDYFGEPVYTYSLKQGIEDGYLAPYQVIQFHLDKDVDGWTPGEGELDDNGKEIPHRKYTLPDFDRNLILKDRVRTIARLVTDEINKIGDKPKTIIFCTNQNHALRMRDELRKINPEWMKEDSSYVVRITANDDEGKSKLNDFISTNEPYPVVATTSKLLTTGANTKCVKLIVLDTPIGSMSEFKQIIGRGTRLVEDAGKTMFTILDFRGATAKFNDPGFDGKHPVISGDSGGTGDKTTDDRKGGQGGEDKTDTDSGDNEGTGEDTGKSDETDTTEDTTQPGETGEEEKTEKIIYVKDGVKVDLKSKTVMYLDKDGKMVTAKYQDFSRKMILEALGEKADFMELWNGNTEKEKIKQLLEEKGILIEHLREAMAKPDLDLFDLICGVAYGSKDLLTREIRASKARSAKFFDKYSGTAREILEELLSIYARQGILEIDSMKVVRHPEMARFGSPTKIVSVFGSRDNYRKAVLGLEHSLYAE